MKQYRIIVTPDAEEDLERYISYIRNIKKNPQAVKSILEDFRETKKSLHDVAGSLRQPYSEELQKRDLKRMNFLKHNYFLCNRQIHPKNS